MIYRLSLGTFLLLVGTANGFSAIAPPTSPSFYKPDTSDISEVALKEAADKIQRVAVPVSTSVSKNESVDISYIQWKPEDYGSSTVPGKLPLVLIHGFDSSCLEYRRLGPKLAALGIDVYAVDLLGWGFTQLQDVESFSAASKVEALKGFWDVVGDGKACAIAGASLGGAAAIEFAASKASPASAAIMIDAQGFVDGVGPMAMLPKPLAELGVQVLKSVPLRSSANQMSYFDKEAYATEDALKVGRLHCLRDGWSDALVSFMLAGGFAPSEKVSKIDMPSLVLWGRQDTILDGNEFANKFVEALPNAELRWVEECGHVPHLERPDKTAELISDFLSSDKFVLPESSEKSSLFLGVAAAAVFGVGAIELSAVLGN